MIDYAHFTPFSSLIGGLLIGISAMILMLFCGRVMGISGVLSGLFNKKLWTNSDNYWRFAFIIGMFGSVYLYHNFWHKLPTDLFNFPIWRLIVGGFVVGFGTILGSGCTSGHGITGLARFSPRSIVAVICFMCTGFATTVYLLN